MSLLRTVGRSDIRNIIVRFEAQVLVLSSRKLSLVPSVYDGEQDPAPKFFSTNVQTLLKRLTRPDFDKIFRKRTNSGHSELRTPKYKFLTDEELELEIKKTHRKAERLLQMPPVVKVQKPITEVLSNDPALVGYDASTYLFTDITFGVDNQHRLIVQRDPDGALRNCDHDLRKKLNQVYFPMKGRSIREPKMFTEQERLDTLLNNEKYEFVLDRACLQYEPDEVPYQKATSIVYQHIDTMKKYDILRSTRHFGPLVFYLAWHQSIDNLMLELLQTGIVRESVLLSALRHEIHGDVGNGEVSQALVQKILPTPIQLRKPEQLTEEDIAIDNECVECIEKYITTTSSMKSQQELALQGFREYYQQLMEVSRGVRKAHGKM